MEAAARRLRALGLAPPAPPAQSKHTTRSQHQNGNTFGVALNLVSQKTVCCCGSHMQIPVIVYDACNMLKSYTSVEGIFRKAGSQSRQRDIKRVLDSGGKIDKTYHAIDIASILKLYLRSLPEPLITQDMQELLLRCLLLSETDHLCAIQLALLFMPISHLHVLHYILEFFKYVSTKSDLNKMDSNNLAIVLAPTIMPPPLTCPPQRMEHHVKLVKFLIENANIIGIVPKDLSLEADEIEKDDARKKKKRRSGSLTRMFTGLRKMVTSNTKPSNPDILATPVLDKGLNKRKQLDAQGFSAKKRKEILENLPSTPHLSNAGKEHKKLRLSIGRKSKEKYLNKNTIRWLGNEAIKRYLKIFRLSNTSNGADKANGSFNIRVEEIRKTRGGVVLDPDDILKNVLDDNEFVNIVLTSDKEKKNIIPDELKHILEPIPEEFQPSDEVLFLDGATLTTDDLRQLGRGRYKIKITKDSEQNIIKSRNLVEKILKEKKVVYGITTGFGNFANTVIDSDKLEELQYNLIRSHSAGVGNPLSPEKTRMLLALRINVLAKGFSGISLPTLTCLINAFNKNCLPWVPEQGSVGASGDLAPLSHLALGIMGEGQMWSPSTGWGDSKKVLEANDLLPMRLGPKEGIALINGTQLITSLGAEAVERAAIIARQADVVASMTLEVLKGTSRAFDADVQKIRPHKGQILVAKRLRALLHSDTYPSQIAQSHRFCNRVQDAYTLRCCPQVHGIVHDTINFVSEVITTEINSGTDNPIVFAERGEIISAGNFHGEYPAKVLDYLAIAIHELASMSERRTERLVNPALSELPAFLVKEGGINSGFMLAHCTAAALVSENKVLCHPSSVDSLSTSAGQEDHVSMGAFSARKALMVIDNVEKVIAIELLAACQAIEFLRPLKTTAPLEEVHKVVRSVVREWDKDRYMAPDIDAVTKLLVDGKIWNAIKHYIDYYHSSTDVEIPVFSPTSVMVGDVQRSKFQGKKRKILEKNGDH